MKNNYIPFSYLRHSYFSLPQGKQQIETFTVEFFTWNFMDISLQHFTQCRISRACVTSDNLLNLSVPGLFNYKEKLTGAPGG